jgi:Threonyl-tRNA synthetase
MEGIRISKGQKFSDLLPGRRDVVAVEVNGKLHDLRETAETDLVFTPVNVNSEQGLSVLRHSGAHLLAQAIMELYPDALLNAGPVTESGFYYDVKMNPPIFGGVEKNRG